MTTVKFKAKKELTTEELENIIASTHMVLLSDDVLSAIREQLIIAIKEIVPADEVHCFSLLPSEEMANIGNLIEGIALYIAISEKSMILPITEKSVISAAFIEKTPVYTNDISRDINYCETTDNPFKYSLKNLMIVPVLDHEENIVAFLWLGISRKNINQYIEKDIENIQKFINANSDELIRFIKNVSETHAVSTEDTKENLPEKEKEREQKTSATDYDGAPVLVKTIKAWLKRLKT